MNREALDEFFAKAEDVLTDWRPSDDAMVARVPDDGAEDRLAPAGESYYDQGWFALCAGAGVTRPPFVIFDDTRWFQAAQRMGEIFTAEAERIREQLQRTMPPIPVRAFTGWIDEPTWASCVGPDPAARALELRRNRNTGPADRRGLDGRFRRNASR